ncbi:hypothetical protein [Brumimicrobium mesophilum]|uniref:hypothetical protein n=1 Tax=Brumimicrobium mesophilum TaxID=392717 RepID=UPI000D144B45|nr:hypothetical protein [Brumimicrobium mesophilum]
MTIEQAQIFFPNPSNEDLEDLWEQRFFEQKQFFLTRPPIHQVWKSRIKKLEQQFNAFLVLTEQEKPKGKTHKISNEDSAFSDEFIVAFHQFHKQRNLFKSALLKAQYYSELVQVIENWLKTELSYAQYWSHPESKVNEIEALISKELDPMEFLKELKATEILITSPLIKDLKENYNILPENVKKEVKRLTLLAKL